MFICQWQSGYSFYNKAFIFCCVTTFHCFLIKEGVGSEVESTTLKKRIHVNILSSECGWVDLYAIFTYLCLSESVLFYAVWTLRGDFGFCSPSASTERSEVMVIYKQHPCLPAEGWSHVRSSRYQIELGLRLLSEAWGCRLGGWMHRWGMWF